MSIPHQGIINVRLDVEVYERLPNGQVSGKVKERYKRSKLFTVLGDSEQDCSENVDELIDKILLEEGVVND